jgi:ABC-type bacteriocin/lantibiotic exporter with double-glycine peptidase domain
MVFSSGAKSIGTIIAISGYSARFWQPIMNMGNIFNNFLNNMHTVHSSQTDLETSLFSSGYIPSYYYGLALKLKF